MVKPGYKQTEIGVIPEDWDCVALLSKCNLLNGLTYTPSNIADNGLLVLRSSNVQNNQIVFSDNVYVNLAVSDEKLIKKNDIIICVRNGSTSLIGKCAKASKDYPITFGAFMAVLRGNNNDYIFQLLQQGTIQKQISKNSGATINQITNGDFKTIYVSFPLDDKEQNRIAEALSDVDELIFSLEKLIEKYKSIKATCLQQMFPQKGETTPKMRLPGFTGAWEQRKFEELYDFASEGGTPDTNNSSFYESGNIPFVKIEDTEKKYIDSTKSYITQKGLNNSSAWLIPENSVIFTNGATVGNVAINRLPVATKQGILGIIPSKVVTAEFMFYLLSSISFQREVKSRIATGTFATIILKNLNQVPVCIPTDKKEQKEISNYLSALDNLITLHQRKLDKAKKIKQGMMQQLLTGKIRLL